MKLNQRILADIFQDNMILPLGKAFRLGGIIGSKEKVNLWFDGKLYETFSNKEGFWQVRISANYDQNKISKILVKSDSRSQKVDNIRYGQVYLLSGQSNIEYRLKEEEHFQEAKKWLRDGKFPELYYYNVPQVDYIDPETGKVKPQNLQPETWHKVNTETAGEMSAVGFYMLKEMRDCGSKLPLAIVDCFKGGTSASVWIKRSDLESDPELNETFLVKYQKQISGKTWTDFDKETQKYNLLVDKHNRDLNAYLKEHPDSSLSDAKNIVGHTPWPPPARPDLYTRPCGLYQTMMQQVKLYSFNGMVWYQGENDTDRAKQYSKLLPLLIATWRRELNDESLPIKLIQLPAYADYPNNSGAEIRAVQLKVSLNIPNVDLVSFIDGGEKHNIHPTNKEMVGERLGKIWYGNDYAGTPYIDVTQVRNRELCLHVARSEKLILKDNVSLELTDFAGNKYHCQITTNNLHKDWIKIPINNKYVKAEYLNTNYSEHIGLYNERNYPVSPFEISLRGKIE